LLCPVDKPFQNSESTQSIGDRAIRNLLDISLDVAHTNGDRDLTSIPPATIRDTRILRTVAGGKTVFERN